FNNDGLLDLVVANPLGTLSLLLGNGDGSFQDLRAIPAGYSPSFLTVADLNHDGASNDLVVVYEGGVRVLLCNGDATFQTSALSYVAGLSPHFAAAADFNGDGWTDLVTANNDSHDVAILLNEGGRQPSPGGAPGCGGPAAPDLFALHDLGMLAKRREPGSAIGVEGGERISLRFRGF